MTAERPDRRQIQARASEGLNRYERGNDWICDNLDIEPTRFECGGGIKQKRSIKQNS